MLISMMRRDIWTHCLTAMYRLRDSKGFIHDRNRRGVYARIISYWTNVFRKQKATWVASQPTLIRSDENITTY